MSVAAMGGGVGFAPEATKVGSGAFTPASYTWRRLRAPSVNLGAIEFNQNFPAEISGFLTPTGPYKGGAFFGGTIDMLPRNESTMGLLYYALMGNLSTVTGKDMNGASQAGVNTHIFNYNALNTIPWLAVRSIVPGSTSAETLAMYGTDCKINAMQFRMTATGKLTARVGIVGRIPSFEKNPTLTWANALEDDTTVSQACDTTFTMGSNSPTVTSVQMDIVNTLSSPQQEMIFGSRHPDDFVPLGRSVSLRVMTKWNTAADLLQALTGSPTGTTWDPEPQISTGIDSSPFGFNFESYAPATIAGSVKSGFAVRGSRAVWLADGQPQMQAGGMVMQGFSLQLTTSLVGDDYCRLIIQNATANSAYAWT